MKAVVKVAFSFKICPLIAPVKSQINKKLKFCLNNEIFYPQDFPTIK